MAIGSAKRNVGTAQASASEPSRQRRRVVLIAGFEVFNAALYRQAAARAMDQCPGLEILIFSDQDLRERSAELEGALEAADALFASLLFDFDQVEWLGQRAAEIPVRLVFESSLELMALTRLGRFAISSGSGGMPRPVRALLDKFGSGREEDRLAAYVGFLKVGPKLLRLLPSRRAQDLRHWLVLYGYWNAGGGDNVMALFLYLARHCLGLRPGPIPPPRSTPAMGLIHPDHDGVFNQPRDYLTWFQRTRPASRPEREHWPVVGLLLYRKHVITGQPYIDELIRAFETAELVPLPVFINGVEGHMAVRDWMTSASEQPSAQRRQAVAVEAIVSTIGFPLVGGPAGSMEAGRREEVAQRILRSKNVPYVVAAPLLIQDIHSWCRQGIGGLQSVVLFALPELDGAIDPVPLGGLVGDRILLVPERLRRLTGRLNAWIRLRRTPAAQRRLAVVLYGFPPGYGATGTAALLNVPASLMSLLEALRSEGYDLGDPADWPADGEELVRRVKEADEAWLSRIPPGERYEESPLASVSADDLRQWLGPLHSRRIERQWGPLTATGIRTLGDRFLLGGVRLGNVWIAVQPPLGVAGDPMRLMYERDLTPHPQYAAFYLWLQRQLKAHAVLHFGMHGTVEWLPGSPLGNTGYSWPDLLLGDLPHLYVYAANNPSESMLAKRRGYGVLISHNVPPYGRAGLYRELVALRDLIG
ncbi:MAG: cobaltochelatase subunit CobN, partial [Synechococcaceae cyanobacterium]